MIKKQDYSCMHGYEEDIVYLSETYSSSGNMYGHIFEVTKSIYSSRKGKFTKKKKCFGKISPEAKVKAQEWCDKWLLLFEKHCTHKGQKFNTGEYGMSITVYNDSCYYSIVRFSEKQSIDLYPAVTAYLYKNVKKVFFGLIPINQELTEETLKQCAYDALLEWDLIANNEL